MFRRTAATLAAIIVSLAMTALPVFGSSIEYPNIVFILADDMGIGDCTIYNPQSKIPTPNIDRIAKEGVRFMDAHSAGSICVPSRYGLLTGENPIRNWPNPSRLHDPNQTTVASLLQGRGFHTAAVGKWHLGFQLVKETGKIKYSPTTVGFDYFFGMNQSLDTPSYYYAENDHAVEMPTTITQGQKGDPMKVTNPEFQGPMWRKGAMAPSFKHSECVPLLTTKAIQYIQSRYGQDSPFFLYFALPAPHAPWLPSDKFVGKSGAGDYGDYMVQVDDCVGQVLGTLETLGIARNTLIIFSSDNGPLWYKPDIDMYKHNSCGIYRGMKGSYYEAGHRVPFVARWPGKVKPGLSSNQLVNFTDVMATFAAIVRAELPTGAGADSHNVLPALLGDSSMQMNSIAIHLRYGGKSVAYRHGDWKLCLPYKTYEIVGKTITPESILEMNKLQLFNLKDDPSESENLVGRMPEKAESMFNELVTNLAKGSSRPGYKQK